MKNQILKKFYRVVVYLRLSADDGDNRESDSISNQRLLIQGYLAGKPEFTIIKECVDDGYTGTNFDRPGFREMMRLVENGEADTVLCKDLSRFGRDFSGVLQYVERIFPKMGVRLILLNDNYDSETSSHDFITLRLKSFINDIYPADTSRSVRANLLAKMTAGQCVASFALYGYLKSPEDKHRLILDPVAASVVQDIFQLKLKGHSMSNIAAILNARGILTPLVYRTVHLKQKIPSGFQKNGYSCWCATMVRRILTDERYTGVLIQGKRTTPNHKVKKVIYKSASEWIRCEDTKVCRWQGNWEEKIRRVAKIDFFLWFYLTQAGKSFSAKREILSCFLMTGDDVIVCDPEGEYFALVGALNGQVVRLATNSKDYLNPMDIQLSHKNDREALKLKSDFIITLCDLIAGGKNGLENDEKGIIDTCIKHIYDRYFAEPKPENMPILEDLYNALLKYEPKDVAPEMQKEAKRKAVRIANSLVLYVHGSQNYFNHRTNVDSHNRIMCFDIRDLGNQLKELGMLIVQDSPYVMVYEKPTAPEETRRMQRWVNNKWLFHSVKDFKDYDPKGYRKGQILGNG